MDNKTKSMLLWIMDVCPLIISENKTTNEAINLCHNGKFILLADSFSKENTKKMSVFRNLTDLDQESQNYKNIVETFQFSIQGKEEITLQTLIKQHDGFRNIITINELFQMLEGSFKIGGEKEELPEIYIDRMLTKNIIGYQFLNNIKDDTLVVISCFGKFDKIKVHLKKLNVININDYVNKNEDIAVNNINQGFTTDGNNFNQDIYISENQCSREEFDEICRKNKEKNKCHHFRVTDDGILEWVTSRGKINDLEKYRSKQHFVNEMQLFDHQNDNNINVIIGEPGMGKSISMKKLKNNYLPTFWTMLIIIKNHSQYFEEENRNADDFIKYILEQTRNLTEFDKNVVNILRKKSLITFLWDGLDELPDENLDSCIKIIKELSEKGFIQWVTTRNHLEKKLEDRFNVFSKAIIPFDVEQQNIYIKKRLTGTTNNLKEISTKIRHYINMVQYNDILGIPLQIFMLTELFIQNPEKYEILLKDIFSIAKLYEHFVDEKLNIYFKEKAELMANNRQRKAIIKDIKIKRLNSHEYAAIGAIFDVKTLTELNIEYEQDLDEIEECFAIGIIIGLTEEKKNKFLHQSYAEYFVATYFRKNFGTIGGKIKKIIFQDRFRNIRFMFDQLLAEDSQPHLAVIYKNLDVLKNCHDLKCKDKAGRNLLHLACSWGARYPVLKSEKCKKRFLIDDGEVESSVNEDGEGYKNMMKLLLCECDPREKDELFAMDSLAYADISLCLLPIVVKLLLDNNADVNAASNDGFTPFYAACQNGHYEVVKLLIINNVDINAATNNGVTPFYAACQNGHCEVVKLLIVNNADINAVTNNGFTPFYAACLNGHYEVVKLLVDNNADVNAPSNDGFTPFYDACLNGQYEVVKLLIVNNADINAATNNGVTPFYVACQNGHYEVVKLLIVNNVDINAATDNGFNPFYAACQNGHYEVVKLLMDNNAVLNAATKNGYTPFYDASLNGHYEVVKLLIANNADINAATKNGFTPFYAACQNGHYELVKLLIANNADINAVTNKGLTPFYAACQNGHYEVVRLLIYNNVDINATTNNGFTAFYSACQNGHYEVVKLLINNNVDVNAVSNNGYTPFYAACQNGHHEVVKLLMDNNAVINVATDYDITPFYAACKNGHYEVVKLLIVNNVDVNASNNNGFTPFYAACLNGYSEVVKLLIDNNANINAANNDGFTPFYAACLKGHYEVVKLLIVNNADINAGIKNGFTPFYAACLNGYFEVVKLLIDNNADINAASNDGLTPFYAACENGHYEVVKLLMDNNADINATSSGGFTPFYAACENGHYEVVKLLMDTADINAANEDGYTPLHGACFDGHYEVVKLLIVNKANINAATKNGVTPFYAACQNRQY
ncbi:uncharacterized protein BDFB_007813, partial [Asbolus verrucosus]